MCTFGTNETAGQCAWTGPNTYVDYFSALLAVVQGS